MNVVSLVNNAEKYLGQKVTVEGILDRPRKKHSSYVFFNVVEGDDLVQVVVKKDLLGKECFKELTYGLSHKDKVSVTGVFDKRSSDRPDFADYEIIAEAISKEVE
jgi:aspartyl/asparaginyl-tRNA synthetase